MNRLKGLMMFGLVLALVLPVAFFVTACGSDEGNGNGGTDPNVLNAANLQGTWLLPAAIVDPGDVMHMVLGASGILTTKQIAPETFSIPGTWSLEGYVLTIASPYLTGGDEVAPMTITVFSANSFTATSADWDGTLTFTRVT